MSTIGEVGIITKTVEHTFYDTTDSFTSSLLHCDLNPIIQSENDSQLTTIAVIFIFVFCFPHFFEASEKSE